MIGKNVIRDAAAKGWCRNEERINISETFSIADCDYEDGEAYFRFIRQEELMTGRDPFTVKMMMNNLRDHYDMDYSTGEFQLDTPAYAAKIRELQEKYRDRIDIRFGVELGLQLHLKERMEEYVNAWPFDYVIGSMHVIDGKDPYYEDAFPDWTAEELYRAYFRATAENIRFFHNFQTLGHLDYVVRYCREKGKDYSYRAFAGEIDTILKELIQYDIALEINTGGYKAGLGVPNPTPDVIRRYRELGGEKITFGADAHKPEHIAFHFADAAAIAQEAGFRYYVRFKEKKPEYLPIQ